ncbi:hypothetical protein [Streptomyces diastaticus]|uniref:hypothetical protein n=1 Tax=Streptomyces diastaticus TaxID=1956 RepID=UPI0035E13949
MRVQERTQTQIGQHLGLSQRRLSGLLARVITRFRDSTLIQQRRMLKNGGELDLL